MEPKEKKAFEPTGLVPRSIVRTFERFRQQLLPGSETVAIREYRISRYQVLVSARCLFVLLTIPIATNWLVSNWLLSPIIEHFWNTKQNEIFLNFYQEERAFAELEFFSEKLFFESLLSNSGVNEFPTLLTSSMSLPKGNLSVSHVLRQKLTPSVYMTCDTPTFTAASGPAAFTSSMPATFLPRATLRGRPLVHLLQSKHGVEEENTELLKCPLKNYCQANCLPLRGAKISDYKDVNFVGNEGPRSVVPGTDLLTFLLPPPRVRGLPMSPTDINQDFINVQNMTFSNQGKSVDSLYNECVHLQFHKSKDFWSISNSNYVTPIFSKYFVESPLLATQAPLLDPLEGVLPENLRFPKFSSFTTSLLPATLKTPFDKQAIFEEERGCIEDTKAIGEKRTILSYLPITEIDHSRLFTLNNPLRGPLGYTFGVQEGVNKRDTLSQQLTEMDSLKIKEKVQDKILELAVYYNQQTILSITNVVGDLVSLFTLGCLFIWMRPEITILKSFLIEAIYSLSDTTKSFLLILLTDLLVGFHSPRGWETALELLLKHFGLPENQDFVFLFVATFPVLLDTVFKYWIFRHLNKISPSTVATYHSMIE